MIRHARAIAGGWAALLLVAALAPAHAQTFPKFTGLVVDAANVLPPETEADLTTKLEALQKDTHRQLVVATIPSLEGREIEDYGYRLGRAWGVGLKDVNNGTILIVAPAEHKVRIEVGYGMEPVLTDALSSVIVNTDIVPRFKAGDLPGGVVAGADAIVAQLRASPDEAKARTDAAIAAFDETHRRTAASGGGGVPIGLIFWGVVLLFVVLPMLRGRRGAGRAYGGGSNWPIVLWSVANEIGRESRGGGWGSSGGGGGLRRRLGRGRLFGRWRRIFRRRRGVGELVSVRLSDADRAAVTAAVTAAEAGTAGEIVTVVAGRSDAYHDVALHWTVLAMLLALALLAWHPGVAEAIAARFVDPWASGPTPPGALFATALVLLALTFLVARLVLAWMPLRLALTPGATEARRVRRQALLLFRAGAERRTTGRTGVLLYLSLAESRAEIIADAAIHERVAPEAWGDAMAALIAEVRDGRPGAGMAAAVGQIGAILGQHLPRLPDDINELPDRVIEL